MNGSENSYAGALFFALISLGAILKIDNAILSCAVGAVAALFAAISLRRALNKSAQAREEDFQRTEIQFQQLRSKIIETSSVNVDAMNSFGDAAQILKDNMQTIQGGLTGFDKLAALAKNVESISLAVASLEKNSAALNAAMDKNSAALNAGLEKISAAAEVQNNPFPAEEFKNLVAIEDANNKNQQTALKILHFIAQTIKEPAHMEELEKINSSVEQLAERIAIFDALKNSVDDVQKNFSDFVRINGEFSRDLMTTLDDTQKNLAELVKINGGLSKDLTSTLDDAHKNLADLVKNNDGLSKNLTKTLDSTQKNISDMVKINNELLKDFTKTLGDAQKNLSDLVKINSGLSKDLTSTLGNTQKSFNEFARVNSGISKDLTMTLDDTQKSFTVFLKNNGGISKDLTTTLENTRKNLVDVIKNNNENSKDLMATLDDLRLDVATFSDKLDTLIDSANENKLTEEDADLLKKIMTKINRK